MRLDPLGTLFFVPAIVSLMLALKWGGSKYSWSNWRVIVLLVTFGLSAVAFGVVQAMMPKTASLPIRIIKQRSMWAGTGFLILLSGAMFMCIYYVPLWCKCDLYIIKRSIIGLTLFSPSGTRLTAIAIRNQYATIGP
jgi:hypothetical protein